MPEANTMSEETDDDICRRALAGSKSSVMKWVERKRPALLNHARVRLAAPCRPVLSESDIVQVTTWRAVRGFSKIRQKTPEKAEAWLFTIQNNHLRTQAVKFANHGHFRLKGELGSILTWAMMQHDLTRQDRSPSDELVRKENDTLIEEAIAHLDIRNQAIVIAISFEGKSFVEAAEELGMSSADAVRKAHDRLVFRMARWIKGELIRRKEEAAKSSAKALAISTKGRFNAGEA
jgi:RNA polymerase sigma factor (sigma-70 family)